MLWGGRSTPHILRVFVRSAVEQFRQSLFWLPALLVVAAVILAEGLLALDSRINSSLLPPFFQTTVSSARALLGTVAGAVITVTGLVFSLAIVALQLTSSQFSPRVLRTLFRSRLQQVVMGFMVGTFTYCLLVLHEVRGPLRSNGDAVIPAISITGALALAVGTGFAILTYVNYVARTMQVSEIIHRTTNDTLDAVHHLSLWEGDPYPPSQERALPAIPDGCGYRVQAGRSGWIQQINTRVLLGAIPDHTTIRVEVYVGRYVPEGTLLCTVWPAGENSYRSDRLIRLAFKQGTVRTTQQDIAFGVQQLSDIALRALSPGINDPTTAYEAIVHLGEVLYTLLPLRLPPTAIIDEHARCLLRPYEVTQVDYINQAFDQIRIFGVGQPGIAIALLETLGMLRQKVEGGDYTSVIEALQRQATLIVQGAKAASLLTEDLGRILAAARRAGFALEDML